MCRGFTFTQPESRRPAAYGAASFLTTTPSKPSRIASANTADTSSRESAIRRRTSISGGSVAASASARTESGSSSRSRPSTCSRSNANSPMAVDAPTVPASTRVAVRDAMTWKASGRPSGPTPSTSPSMIRSRAGSAATAATTSGSRSVMSSRLRE